MDTIASRRLSGESVTILISAEASKYTMAPIKAPPISSLCRGAAAGASMAVGAVLFRDCMGTAEAEGKPAKLDVNFMDLIAEKPYLNYNSIQSVADKHHQTSHHFRKIAAEVQTTISAPGRPQGVPSRLRLLAIDVPELKERSFDRDVTTCKPPSEIFDTADPTFEDGVAKSKKMDTSFLDRKIAVQKSLARQVRLR